VVIGLTLSMMTVELAAGSAFGSMAPLADGWRMGTHAAALSVAAFAYLLRAPPCRRSALQPRNRQRRLDDVPAAARVEEVVLRSSKGLRDARVPNRRAGGRRFGAPGNLPAARRPAIGRPVRRARGATSGCDGKAEVRAQ